MKNKIIVQDQQITIIEDDYISLTDMVKNIENGLVLIEKWLRNKNTIEFLGVWEEIYNTDFNSPEFEGIKNEAGSNRFSLSVKMWINKTNAIGILAKAGRYGGTYAHKDIAFEFASWISPKFKLYLIKEFQRLKNDEIDKQSLDWDIKRTIVKMNYHIHTDAIKNHLIPEDISKNKISYIYANEGDLLNIALFGITAKEWRESNPTKEGNIRDYASAEQLVVLANLENQLIENIKNFLLELGYGFSFIDSQYKLTLEENEYYTDLLFFHRKLNALVAIELKLGKYKPEYAGKMNFYLNLLNDTVKMPHENPSIGIILCTDKNKLEVEYSLKSISQPMGVSTYTMQEKLPHELKNALPTKEELEELVKDDLEKIEGKTK